MEKTTQTTTTARQRCSAAAVACCCMMELMQSVRKRMGSGDLGPEPTASPAASVGAVRT
jgi:hypothetical protein